MAITENAKAYHEKMFPSYQSKFLETDPEFIERFDIFVCGPCWWGTYPCAVFSQLERLNFAGKRVFALMTHEGSGLGSCERDLHRLCSGATIGKGLAVRGSSVAKSEKQVADWAKSCVK